MMAYTLQLELMNINNSKLAQKALMAKIALIVGSVRHERQGIKVARWMEQKLKDRNHTVLFIDPIEINLPLLDRMYKEMTNPPEMLRELENMQNVLMDGSVFRYISGCNL